MSTPEASKHIHSHDRYHGHGHGHGHGHTHGHDFAGENQKHYDATAAEYDARADVQELAKRVREAMLKAFPSLFDEDRTTLMDYACGTGAVSRELSPYVRSIVGVDISQGVVDHFNKRVADQGIPPEEMRAVCAELHGTDDELDGAKFDVITCSVAYHHFPSITDTTKILASFLKPGGSLLVIDFVKEESSADFTPAEFAHIVPHRSGFTEDEICGAFEGAGLGEFSFRIATRGKRHGNEVNFFLARGVRLQTM